MGSDLVAERCVGEEDDVGLKERASNQGLRLDSVTEGSQARSRIWTIFNPFKFSNMKMATFCG